MKHEQKIELTIWGDGPSDYIWLGKRSRERREKQKELILEVLQNVAPQKLTKGQLQRLAGIRRERFIKVLKRLIEQGVVFRYGLGTKSNPFTYSIPT